MKSLVTFVLVFALMIMCCACHPSDFNETENTDDMTVTEFPAGAPTVPPVDPTNPPTEPPTDPPTQPPTDPPTEPPTEPPTQPSYDMPVITAEAEDMIKTAYIASTQEEYQKDELRLEYYGEYEGVHIAFVDGPWDYSGLNGSEVVAGVEFIYSSRSRTPKAFKDGEMLPLQEALDAGWLSEAAIHELWELYRLVYWYAYIEY